MPLSNVEACSLVNPSMLPPEWQPLTVDPNPIAPLGDSNCYISNPERGVGISITIYRGPGRGIDELSKTTASTPTPLDVGGRQARIYRDTPGKTCGILFDFGPDQGLIVNANGPDKAAEDPCASTTTVATAMVPNLPPA